MSIVILKVLSSRKRKFSYICCIMVCHTYIHVHQIHCISSLASTCPCSPGQLEMSISPFSLFLYLLINLYIQPTCAMSSVLYTWRRLLSKEDLQLQEGLNRKQRSIAKNNGIGQAASCCVLMEEDFVTKLLRNSGNSAPDQQNRGASGNTSATGPYQNLRVPEVSGLWDSTIDLSRTHDATTTKTAQVCSLFIFKHRYTSQRYW